MRGEEKLTITMVGCRMRDYVADGPITCLNPKAVIEVIGCFDKDENVFKGGEGFCGDMDCSGKGMVVKWGADRNC